MPLPPHGPAGSPHPPRRGVDALVGLRRLACRVPPRRPLLTRRVLTRHGSVATTTGPRPVLGGSLLGPAGGPEGRERPPVPSPLTTAVRPVSHTSSRKAIEMRCLPHGRPLTGMGGGAPLRTLLPVRPTQPPSVT